MKSSGIFLCSLIASIHIALAQDSVKIFHNRKKTLIVTSTVAYTGSIIILNKAWYSQYDRQSFRFFNDAREWYQMDKLGHTYSAFHITAAGSRVIQWAGVNSKKSDRLAAISSFGIMASIEVLDGFSAGYGASLSDITANTAGIGLYWGQKALWDEIRIHPKFSFRKSSLAAQRPSVLGKNLPEQILKDYNGQTQWLSIDLDKFNDRFPKWLNLAIGYGADGMIYAHAEQNEAFGLSPQRQFYFALDFDVSDIKTKSKAVKTLLYVLNMVKLPAPSLEFSGKKIRGHYFYF